MATINTAYFDRVRYTLKSKSLDSLIVTEPIGWNDDEKEFSRHEQYHGIVTKFSNSLKFIDAGADYLQLILDLYGRTNPRRKTPENRQMDLNLFRLFRLIHLGQRKQSSKRKIQLRRFGAIVKI
jgi:hypothetical protein